MLRSKKRRAALAASVVLALMWLLWPDRQLARVRAIQAQLGDQSLTDGQRGEKFRELRDAMRNLSPSQRDKLMSGQRGRMEDELRRYAKMSPQEKKQYLDNQINREQEMLKRRAQTGSQPKAGPPGAPPGGPGGGPPRAARPSTPEDKERRRSAMLDRSTPEFRGLMDQMRRDLEQRRKQRGLPLSSGFGRR